jgi:hypothetical protein
MTLGSKQNLEFTQCIIVVCGVKRAFASWADGGATTQRVATSGTDWNHHLQPAHQSHNSLELILT